ncbi:hypothetical protein DL93DRAFT_2159697, partial [Clavulina sp. PMI_390]
MIQERDGMPANQQRLIYGGKPPQDGHDLMYHNITKEATLRSVLRLPGGISSIKASYMGIEALEKENIPISVGAGD